MEAVQVQAVAQQAMVANGMAKSFMVGSPSQTGGGFMELMMQLLNGMQEAMPEGEPLLDGEIPEQLEEQLKKEGSVMGMQMLTDLLMASQMHSVLQQSATLAQNGEAPQASAAVGTNVSSLLDILTGQNQTTQLPQGVPTGENTSQTQQSTLPFASLISGVQNNDTSAQAGTQGETPQSFSGESQFQQAVMQAQKLMQGTTKPMEAATEPVDIEALQTKVDASKTTNGGAQQLAVPVQTTELHEAAEIELPDARDLMSQVKTGILSGMQSGKNEFIIKLKPDGLGEITVKLTEMGSKMSLSIITSNAQTQRMITGEMAGLRETMRPLGVEVQPVVSQEAGHFNAQQQSNFGGHQHQQFNEDQNQQSFNYWRDDVVPDEASAAEFVKSPAMAAALNIAI